MRHKPLGEFEVEDLRIMIGQNVGLPHLVPLAIKQLEQDPLAEGDYYQGDLLCALLQVEASFWLGRPELREKVASLLEDALVKAKELDEVDQECAEEALAEAGEVFRENR